jgi:hypothetical protein
MTMLAYKKNWKSDISAATFVLAASAVGASAAQFTVADGYAGTPGNGNRIVSGYSFADLGIGRVVVTDGTSGTSFANGTCAGQGNVLCIDVYIYDTSNNLIASYQDATSDWQQKTSNVTDGFSIEGLTPDLNINGVQADALFLVIPMRTVSASGNTGTYEVSGSADPFDAADANLVLGYLNSVAPNISGPNTTSDVSSTDTKSVTEGTTAVHTFTADEPVTWSISGGANAGLFTINPTSGTLAFQTAPAYDPNGTNQYVVEVMATDADGIPVTMTLTATVVPQDAVDPVITGPSNTAGAATDTKSIPEGTTAVHTFTANEPVTWSISGGANAGLFTLNPNSGALAFLAAPTYDPNGTNQYVVAIEAEDAAGNTSTMTVTVTVTDAGDPVITGPSNTAGAATDTKSIPEGTTAVHTFTANEPVTWSISGGANAGLFTLNPNSGALAFLAAPTYDPNGTNQYVVIIEAEDAAGNTSTVTVTVTVTDAGDPVITGPSNTAGAGTDTKSIPEGTTAVHTFTANEPVTWSISGGANAGLFTLNPSSGALAFLAAPTYDPNGTNQYVVIIEAEDAAGNTSTVTVTVFITDTAEAALNRARNDVEQIIADVEVAKLRSQQDSVRSLTNSARDRLSGGGCGGTNDDTTAATDDESCRDQRDRDLNISADGTNVSISGSGRSVRFQGDSRRIAQFDLQASRQTGLTSLSFNGKMAYEIQPSDSALYGVFVGLSLSNGEVVRSFSGDLTSGGLSLGGYAVHEITRSVFSEAYAAIGAGRNQLQLGDGHLAVKGDYDSTEMHLGWIVSGLIERGQWEYWPEVALQWSRSRTSAIRLSGAIPGGAASAEWAGLTSSLASAALATEVVYSFGPESAPWSIRFKPGFLCEDIRGLARTTDCGAMLIVGLDHESEDDRHRLAAKASVEDVGTDTRSSATLSYELRF